MPKMHQRQQNPWRGLAVGWLKDNVLRGPVPQLLPDFFPMVGAYDNKNTITRNQTLNRCQRMLQHRAPANHSRPRRGQLPGDVLSSYLLRRWQTLPKTPISPTNISHFLQSMAISVP